MFPHTRRRFLKSAAAASAVLTFGPQVPAFLQAAAQATTGSHGRILVVVELAGGNDGLNTVVPLRSDDYRRLRPGLAVPAADTLRITDEAGLHPALQGFAKLLEAGQLAVVQGVGYDNPNRSHFESMDIWHTCQRKDELRVDGWLGRYLEQSRTTAGIDPSGLHVGSDKQPFALMSRQVRVPSIRSLEQFRLEGTGEQEFRQAVQQLTEARRTTDNDLLGFVQSSTSSALAASARIERTGKAYQPATVYPQTDLAEKLRTVARLIVAGLQTAVYYVQLDGFDTHAQQAPAHAALLRQLSDAVHAFVADMVAQGHGDRVLLLSFSEFGRRVAENASEGTDHGTAGPVFLAGTGVRAGLHGAHPALDQLVDGDLQHHTDFRQVYATVLERWLSCDSSAILKGDYQPVDALNG